MADTDYEKELETYIDRLRKIAVYQLYIITPFLWVMVLIQTYQLYYARSWTCLASVLVYAFCAMYNYRDARRTFGKIMLRTLTGS